MMAWSLDGLWGAIFTYYQLAKGETDVKLLCTSVQCQSKMRAPPLGRIM
jgi:hypothetical protein